MKKRDCSKILDYIHERDRMCQINKFCDNCPFHVLLSCDVGIATQEAIDILQKWSDEHPQIMKLSKKEHEFLKTFLISRDKAIIRGKLINDLYVHDSRHNTYSAIDPTMFSFIREEEQMTFDELLSLRVKDEIS